MIRCYIPRVSRIAKWLTIANRTFTDRSNSHELLNDFSNPHKFTLATTVFGDRDSVNLPASISGSGNYGGEVVSMQYKPRELPLSPFMVPEVTNARQRHKTPKLPSSKTPTLFQRQLARNPYARALVTPLRQCHVTNTRLPTYFLQDFEIMAHPKTKEPWWVPTSLRRNPQHKKPLAGTAKEASITSGPGSEPIADRRDGGMEATAMLLESQHVDLAQRTVSIGPGVYTLSRKDLLHAMRNPKSGWPTPPWKYFQSGAAQRSSNTRSVINHTAWRTDMDSFILNLMRRRVVEGLIYLVQRKRGYVAGCLDWEDAKTTGRQQGAILWTGKEDHQEVRGLFQAEVSADEESEVTSDLGTSARTDSGHVRPGGYATLTIGEHKPHMVPVHNLPMLLGSEHLKELRTQCPIFAKEVLILRAKSVTVDIQMRLWRLQGYVGLPEFIRANAKVEREKCAQEAEMKGERFPTKDLATPTTSDREQQQLARE